MDDYRHCLNIFPLSLRKVIIGNINNSNAYKIF